MHSHMYVYVYVYIYIHVYALHTSGAYTQARTDTHADKNKSSNTQRCDLMYVLDSHSYVRHDVFIYTTWPNDMCDMAHPNV